MRKEFETAPTTTTIRNVARYLTLCASAAAPIPRPGRGVQRGRAETAPGPDQQLGAVGCMRLLGSAGHRTQPCRDALPRPAGPAALPRKTVPDGPAVLVATVPYGCGPRTAPRDAPPPFRPASRCVTGSAVNPSSLAVRCRPGQCPERPRPLGPGIDGRVRCARSLKPHPQQQQSGTSRAT